jgi:ribonuclease I
MKSTAKTSPNSISSARALIALSTETSIIFAVALFGIMLTSVNGQDRRESVPGRFDYYVLSLSWSPSFCETATGDLRELCAADAFFSGYD